MSTTEAGDPTNYPASITIPSDGDGPTIKAADVNVAFEGLADRTANLDARLAPVETGILLVNRKGYTSVSAINLSFGTTTASNTLFSSGITTQVGDEIEVSLLGTGSMSYGSGATTGILLVVELWASQNGGAFSRLGYCRLGSQDGLLNANDTSTDGAIALLGLITIASAGTLAVEIRLSFSGTPQAGDLAEILLYRASLHQYRSP